VNPLGTTPTIGVLALQGDVLEHERVLSDLDVAVRRVRNRADLDAVDGLVLPGGESTTMSMLLDSAELTEPLRERLRQGMPALGTCAGMILLASSILDGRADQHCLAGIDITVRRNAFGRQTSSFEADIDVTGFEEATMHATFIRAPVIEAVGPEVVVLASVRRPDGETRPVLCRSGVVTAAAFHPELSGEQRLHRLLISDVVGKNDTERGVE
jgi:5'-phosphate synthase pdxT subunit